MKKFYSLLFALICIFSSEAFSSSLGEIVPVSERMEVSVGQSTIIKLRSKPERVSLSNPGIAYVMMLAPDQIQIVGRNPGRTNLFVWFAHPENSLSTVTPHPIGTEISVGLPKPPYITSVPSMEIVNGNRSELIYLSAPQEKLRNPQNNRTSGFKSDMPESCLTPGCL